MSLHAYSQLDDACRCLDSAEKALHAARNLVWRAEEKELRDEIQRVLSLALTAQLNALKRRNQISDGLESTT